MGERDLRRKREPDDPKRNWGELLGVVALAPGGQRFGHLGGMGGSRVLPRFPCTRSHGMTPSARWAWTAITVSVRASWGSGSNAAKTAPTC
jgi:hypothetical protein